MYKCKRCKKTSFDNKEIPFYVIANILFFAGVLVGLVGINSQLGWIEGIIAGGILLMSEYLFYDTLKTKEIR